MDNEKTYEEILEECLELPIEDRLWIIEELMKSLETDYSAQKLWQNPPVEDIAVWRTEALERGASSIVGYCMSKAGGLADPEYIRDTISYLGVKALFDMTGAELGAAAVKEAKKGD